MRRIGFAFSLIAVTALLAGADDSAADIFTRDHTGVSRSSRESGVPVAITIALAKGETSELLADPRIKERLKWFTPLTVQPTTKLAKSLNAESPTTFAIVDGKGTVLLRGGAKDPPEAVLKDLIELGRKTRAGFQAKLASNEATDGESKAAIAGLVRTGGSAAELVPLLRHRSAEVRSAAAKALPALPADDVTLAALDGLASDDVEMRAACHKWAAAHTQTLKPPPLKFWREENEDARKKALTDWRDAALIDMGSLNRDILEFCEAKMGKQVGGGECSHLAEEAFKLVNAKPIQFSGKTYLWGREVTAGRKVLPGDVVQLEDCKFKNGSAPHHTQVIRKVLGPNRYEVLEQNANGRRTVGPGELDLNKLVEGTVKIYRPLPK